MNKFLYLPFIMVFLISCQTNKAQLFVPCDFIEGLADTTQLQCGKISVPENHDEPKGKKIQIAFVVLKAKKATPEAYPMIYLSGGPGVGQLTTGNINRWLQHPVREKRDIILLDQRGIGHSSALPNLHQELYEVMAKNADEEAEQLMMKEVLAAYAQKCRDQKIQLQHYNTIQNARDIGALMKHLPYKKYNVYGVSYGTRLGRVVQDRYPDYLHAAIYNSPNPFKGDMLVDRLYSYSLALERLFAYCENNAACNAQYPNLKVTYMDALAIIEQQPLEMEGDSRPYIVNVQDAIFLLRRQLYSSDSREKAPALIQEFHQGGGPITKDLIARDFGPGYNYSMWMAVERYEMYDPKYTSEAIEEIYQTLPLLPAHLGFFDAIYQTFGDFHTAILPAEEKIFQQSDVPTMITVNQYDPVTPPENGHIFKKELINAQLFILDEGGHGGGDAVCRNKVMIAFMDDPLGTLDASCLNLYRK